MFNEQFETDKEEKKLEKENVRIKKKISFNDDWIEYDVFLTESEQILVYLNKDQIFNSITSPVYSLDYKPKDA